MTWPGAARASWAWSDSTCPTRWAPRTEPPGSSASPTTSTHRYPAYRLPPDHLALFQASGGFVLSERAIVAHVVAAQAAGAEVRARERVVAWEPTGNGVRVTTDRATYQAGSLVVCAGAWIGELVPELAGIAVAERQVLAWLQPDEPAVFAPDRFPVFNLMVSEGRYYGLPVFGVPGFKFGRYGHRGERVAPDTMERDADSADESLLRAFAASYVPHGAGPTMALRTCLFTNTPDGHFILDRHPTLPQVVLTSPCSGHGYKFCAVVGEVLADLVDRAQTDHDVSRFRANRF